jgi:hypothetical protein
MKDPATGWFEIHEYDDKRSITVANITEQEWFSRYPWPTQVTYDRGSEFIGKDLLQTINIDQHPRTQGRASPPTVFPIKLVCRF